MEFLLQQFPIQENLIPLLSEADLLNLSRCSTSCKRVCEYWIGGITLPNDFTGGALFNLCRDNKIISVNLAINRGFREWDVGLWGACEGGHRDLAELMISKGATDWNWGLTNACRYGHGDLAELMITKGANDWNGGLMDACRYDHSDLVELMISKGGRVCCHCERSMEEHLSH